MRRSHIPRIEPSRGVLSSSLARAHKHFGQMKQDARISSLIETLPKQYLGKEYTFTERVSSTNVTSPTFLDYRRD